MIRSYINPAYRSALEACSLTQFDQVMTTRQGELLAQDRNRDLRKLHISGESCYLKCTRVEKWHSALESYLSGKLAHSKPFKEMLQFRYLCEQGFGTARVIAAGEELRLGMPQTGFILTWEVSGLELSQKYRDSTGRERLQILADLSVLVGQLHRN